MTKTTQQRLYPQMLELDSILSLIGDQVSVKIFIELSESTKRFSEFSLKVSSKTLSNRLKQLANHGLITRTLHAEVPPRSEYALTEKGREFVSIVQGFLQWEQGWKLQPV